MRTETLVREFQNRFHREPEGIFFCPGRVNLIGEHIDYNGGRVLPCAIERGTWLAVSRNTDRLFRFHCLDFPETAELHLQSSYSKSGKAWYNYPLGVIHGMLQGDLAVSGLDFLFGGNLPVGAGLSSSASIEVLTGFALSDLFAANISRTEIALLSREAENRFIGVNCGIMDQFAVAMGKKDMALLLNCDTYEYEYLPFRTGEYSLVIINSRKERSLAESKYNERFAECGAALKLLKRELEAENLCDVSPADFGRYRYLLGNPVLEKRAWHVISEQARVNDAVIALQTGDLEIFGKLMNASHRSLQENYEVSGPELDIIAGFSQSFPGCLGARMTGAGFGGCAIALVKKRSFDDFASKLTDFYRNRTGLTAEIFETGAADGVRRL